MPDDDIVVDDAIFHEARRRARATRCDARGVASLRERGSVVNDIFKKNQRKDGR